MNDFASFFELNNCGVKLYGSTYKLFQLLPQLMVECNSHTMIKISPDLVK